MPLLMLMADVSADYGEAVKSDVFPPFDPTYYPSQLFWLAITFGALYFILSRMILPKLGANLERRSDAVADDLDEAARLNEQAEDAQKTLEKNLAEARAAARAKSLLAEQTVSEEIAIETQKVDRQIDEKLKTAETRITVVRSEAMDHVQSIATDTTKNIIAKLGFEVSEKEAVKAVEGAMDD